MPRSEAVDTVEEAEQVAGNLGYPVVIRPAYTMGGTGGGLVYNVEELRVVAARGLAASLVESGAGGRIGAGLGGAGTGGGAGCQKPDDHGLLHRKRRCHGRSHRRQLLHGAHADHRSGPAERLQKYSYAIVEAIEVIGGTNVQFAHDPKTGRVVVIEINPRTSRSSALASKATGFPIARVSSLLAGGLTMDEIPYWRDGTLEKYTPSGDYVVVKFARWAFEKFEGIEDKLGTQMRAVGEVMSIGKNYKEAFQKAIRSLENGRYGLGFAKDFHAAPGELMQRLAEPPASASSSCTRRCARAPMSRTCTT
jgi:carbamoyl-phosphate synthase large subunit